MRNYIVLHIFGSVRLSWLRRGFGLNPAIGNLPWGWCSSGNIAGPIGLNTANLPGPIKPHQ